MLDRATLDRITPDTAVTRAVASAIMGRVCIVESALLWLAELAEADRFPKRPEWWTDPLKTPWPIEPRGLEYKTSLHYLTLEGWPMSTKCWYVAITCGYNLFICGETPALAAMRAVIVCHALKLQRENEADHRRDLDVIVSRLNAEAIA